MKSIELCRKYNEFLDAEWYHWFLAFIANLFSDPTCNFEAQQNSLRGTQKDGLLTINGRPNVWHLDAFYRVPWNDNHGTTLDVMGLMSIPRKALLYK